MRWMKSPGESRFPCIQTRISPSHATDAFPQIRPHHPGVQPIPPSAFTISPQAPARVAPCGIDWTWTHNPGIYTKAGLSEDLIAVADGKTAEWKVTYPGKDRFFFVL